MRCAWGDSELEEAAQMRGNCRISVHSSVEKRDSLRQRTKTNITFTSE